MNERTDYEGDQVSVRSIVAVAIGLAATVALSLILIGLAYDFEVTPPLLRGATHKTIPAGEFPEPRLEVDGSAGLAQWKARQRQKLHGNAALPIEQAMHVIATGGERAWAPLIPKSKPPEAKEQSP